MGRVHRHVDLRLDYSAGVVRNLPLASDSDIYRYGRRLWIRMVATWSYQAWADRRVDRAIAASSQSVRRRKHEALRAKGPSDSSAKNNCRAQEFPATGGSSRKLGTQQ